MRIEVFGSGPVVVKLAGMGGGVGLFREEIESVSRAGFRVVALDLSGDRRDDPAPVSLSWDFYTNEVVAALDRLRESSASLWGSSFGCLVALATAARAPGRVSGLLLCHPPDPFHRPRYQEPLLRWILGHRDPERATHLALSFGFRALISWEAIHPPMLRRLPALLRANAEAATPDRTLFEKMRLLVLEPPGLPPQNRAIPVSILAGGWDLVAPLSGARALAARLPGARLVRLARSGHSGSHTHPRLHARVVVEELTRITRPTGTSSS